MAEISIKQEKLLVNITMKESYADSGNFENQVRVKMKRAPRVGFSRVLFKKSTLTAQCLTGNQVSNGGEQRQMESISRQQHLDLGRPNSFQSLALNNGSNTSKKSVNLNVTSPFMSYAEVLNTNFRPTMVSTTSTPTPSTQTSPFYLLRDDAPTPSESNSNLLVKHGFEQTYQKSKKVKEGLSSFLPHLPGVLDELGGPENSLRSVVDKPPIGEKELLPLTGHSLSGFRLNPGPIPEQFRFMSQHPVKKKHKHKKHKSQESERSKEGGEAVSQGSNSLEQDKPTPSSAEKPEVAHDSKKHKKQKKHEDGERKKKKKEKKKKKRHTPDATPPGGGVDPT